MPIFDISSVDDNDIVSVTERFKSFIGESVMADLCPDENCKQMAEAIRIEKKGVIRFVSFNRNKNILGVPLKSFARVDLSSFNILSCIVHEG